MEQQIEEYIDYISRNNQKTENTLLSYRRDLYKLMTYLCDELNIHEWGIVTQTDLNSYILHLQKEDIASATIARYVVSMKAFFEYLHGNGMIDDEPAADIKPPRHEKKVPGIISVENVVKLLTAPDGGSPKQLRDRAMLELLYATGIKVSELVAVKMEDINLHFTGDIHAITSANNLLSAMIDNHIYYGNKLDIQKVTWKRCVDLNDRQLRKIETGLSGEKKIVPREDSFDITVASEIMAILCLSENIEELKQKLGNIIIGYNSKEEPIYARDIKADGAMAVLLKDAIKPNLVQTLEYTPAIIHGGPFANIAHGCNSIIATKLAMKLADYTVTEAGFGADLGAEKFLDIKCRKAQIKPDVVVLVATIKALKYHGGVNNLLKHIENIKEKFGINVIVAINKFNTDTEEEINSIKEKVSGSDLVPALCEVSARKGYSIFILGGAQGIAEL